MNYQFRVFGVPSLYIADEAQRLHSVKTLALLAYLAIQPDKQHSRTRLATLLWGDSPEKRAAQSLRQALYSIRQVLDDNWLDVTPSTVIFQPGDNWWIDSDAFDTALMQNPPDYGEAIALYGGELLEGVDAGGDTDFDSWLIQTRVAYKRKWLQALLGYASQHIQRGNVDAAIPLLDQVLEQDTINERAYRLLMRVYAAHDDIGMVRHIYQICAESLQRELKSDPTEETQQLYQFLTTPTNEHNHLPAPTTPIIGREADLIRLDMLLSDPENRLVTIIGMGGIGKTRFVIAYAQRTIGEVAFVALQNDHDLKGALYNIADKVGLNTSEKGDLQERLLTYLERRQLMLILDNIEHIADLSDLVNELLENTSIRILATSRHALEVVGERSFPLDGLPVTMATSDQGLSHASRLFVEFAHRTDPNFRLTSHEQDVIQRFVTLVDGNPLAIRLAAGWVHALPVSTIYEATVKTLDLLESEQVDLPQRHRSIRATFDYSWSQLTDEMQQTLMNLVMFQVGFSAQAVQQITGAGPLLLANLIQRSWLDFDSRHKRYTMHPLLHHFVTEKRTQTMRSGTIDFKSAQQAYIDYFHQKIVAYSATYNRSGDELVADFDDIQNAWHLAIQQQNIPVLEEMLEGLVMLCVHQSRFQEGVDLLEAARGTNPSTQLLRHLGDMHREVGDFDTAQSLYTLCQQQARDVNDTLEVAWSYTGQAMIYIHWGDYSAAWEAINHAEEFSSETAGPLLLITIATRKALAAVFRSLMDEALLSFEQALNLAREIGHTQHEAKILTNIGNIYMRKGQHTTAHYYYEKSYALHPTHNNAGNLGITLYMLGDHETAQKYMESSLSIVRSKGLRLREGSAAYNLGELHQTQGEFDKAEAYFRDALRIQRKIGNRRGVIRCYDRLGLLHAFKQQFEMAASYFEQGETYTQQIDEPRMTCSLKRSQTIMYALQSDYKRAIACSSEFMPFYETHTLDGDKLCDLAYQSWWYLQIGDLQTAIHVMMTAIEFADSHDNLEHTEITYVIAAYLFHAAGDLSTVVAIIAPLQSHNFGDYYQTTYIVGPLLDELDNLLAPWSGSTPSMSPSDILARLHIIRSE